MLEIEAEEVLTLCEKEEGKLFNISFVNHEKKDSRKRVFPNIQWNSIVEKPLEQKRQTKIQQEDDWKFKNKKFQIICEETESFRIFF